MTAARRAHGIDYELLHLELLPVLERHGVIAPGERLNGWVGLVQFTGVDADGGEYTRSELIPGPGVSVGEVRSLLADGAALFAGRAP